MRPAAPVPSRDVRAGGRGERSCRVTSEWFPGAGRNADDEVFLAELRALAESWGLADVRPEATAVRTHRWGWLVVCARVPRLDAGDADPQLQVGFDLSDSATPPLVATWETDGFLLDSWNDLSHPSPTPTGMAEAASAWMGEQLRRPVERRTWETRRLRRRSTYSAWFLADTERLLCQHPERLRSPRGVPEWVQRLR
jgi:hypothetical protein